MSLVFGIFITMGLPLLLLAIMLYIAFFKRKRNDNKYSMIIYILLIWMVELIVYSTLLIGFTFDFEHHFINLIPFVWLFETYEMGFERMMQQIILNSLMFLPIGLLLPIVESKYRDKKNILMFLAIMIFAIEFIQYFIGRSCDIDDFICNLIGGIIGYVLYNMIDIVYSKNKFWLKVNNMEEC